MTDFRQPSETKAVYRVEGFSCANCAGKFERNVKQLPGVRDAKVNFAAAKITVIGHATIEELEKAGEFEKLKVIPERPLRGSGEAAPTVQEFSQQPFYKRHAALLVSALFIVLGYVSFFTLGERHLLTVAAYLLAILIGGYSLFKTGLQNLLRLDFDMRTLMTVAIIGAAIIGEWAEGAVVVILFAISEALERYSMDRARRSIRSLMDIAPKEALVRRDGQEQMMRVEEIAAGDVIIVKPGEKIAMDGVVIGGHSTVDQAPITGESVPVEKAAGDEVYAGTLNGEGSLEIKVTKLVEDTTIAKIIHLVEEAQAERAPAQAFVDRFAKVYTPIIMAIAAFVAVVPPLIDGRWEMWVYQGLSVLVVGCPCALVISTPISIVSAIGNAARHGVLFKGGIYLEEMGRLKAIAFDKTGTLTKGVPAVTDVVMFGDGDERQLLTDVAALEYRSQHPIAAAIVREAEQQGLPYQETEALHFSSHTGLGIEGVIGGRRYLIGRVKLFREMGIELGEEHLAVVGKLQAEGKTVVLAGTNQRILAAIAVADEVRESSQAVIRELHQLGVDKTVMLTGDNPVTAQAIAGQLGVAEVRAELMPQEKLEYIEQLKREYQRAAMVGDGVNDAPALAAASVGIAMGGAGTDTALETAHVALMADDLSKLPFAIRLSRRTLRIIKQNITFSLGIKLLALLLVIPGWLTLWIAIASDMGATLLVALNGMRLMKVRAERE